MNEKDLKLHKGKIKSLEKAATNLFYITIKTNEIINIKSGQFISVLCGDLTLRRPFSVMGVKGNEITLLFKLKGKGTEYLKNLKENDEIDFTGPFGNGFNIENKKSLLIAAGVGVAPIQFLKTELSSHSIENFMMAGFLNEDNIPNGVKTDFIATDDGSSGEKGSVITYVEQIIQEYNPEKLYACGPYVVLKLVSILAEKYNFPCEVAMEKEMACSIGVCRGCVVELKNGKNASVCKDGPVFEAKELLWS